MIKQWTVPIFVTLLATLSYYVIEILAVSQLFLSGEGGRYRLVFLVQALFMKP